NGYNNTLSDGHASTTGYAVLYIVDIQTGSLIRKISTKTGSVSTPNGLATPAVVDLNGDGFADYVYAGDLLGNMWKFVICDLDAVTNQCNPNPANSNPANWKVAYTDGSGNPAPLYVAKDGASPSNNQSITDRPEVGVGTGSNGMLVLFGTGRYLEPNDKLLPPDAPRRDQSFYGIIDINLGPSDTVSGRGALQRQTIDAEATVTVDGNPYNVRVTSNTKGNNG